MTSISVFEAVAPVNEALRELDWLDYMACAAVVCSAARNAYAPDEEDRFGGLMDATISAIEEVVTGGSANASTLEADWEAASDGIRRSSVPGLIALRTSLYILSGEIAGTDRPYASLEWLLMAIVNFNLDRPGAPKAARTENDRAIAVDGSESRALEDVRELIAKVRLVGRSEILQRPPIVRIG